MMKILFLSVSALVMFGLALGQLRDELATSIPPDATTDLPLNTEEFTESTDPTEATFDPDEPDELDEPDEPPRESAFSHLSRNLNGYFNKTREVVAKGIETGVKFLTTSKERFEEIIKKTQWGANMLYDKIKNTVTSGYESIAMSISKEKTSTRKPARRR